MVNETNVKIIHYGFVAAHVWILGADISRFFLMIKQL